MENNCKNCKYYNGYYIIFKGKLSNFGGHCVHDKVYSAISKRNFIPRNNCEFWEDKSELIENRRNDIIKDLHAMNLRLEDIIKILNVDKE